MEDVTEPVGQWRALRRGHEERERSEFSDLVSPHMPAMAHLAARLARGESRDDIVQEALSRAWRKRKLYDPARGTVRTWLLAITAGEARRALRRPLVPIRVEPAQPPTAIEDRLDLVAAVDRLPPRQRLAVDCFYFAGLTVAETAAVMDCAEGTVKSALSDARARLRVLLENEK